MNAEELAEKIVKYVERLDFVTHGNLISEFGSAAEGTITWEIRGKNLVLFAGMSELLADAFDIISAERPQRVVLDYCDPLCHYMDGTPLLKNTPWAKRPPKGGYKKTHLVSTCLRPASRVKHPVTIETS